MLLSCRETASRVDAYVAGALDARSALALRSHLRSCASCLRRHDEAMRLPGLLRVGSVRVPPLGYIESFGGRVVEGMASRARARRASRRSRVLALGACTALLVAVVVPWLLGGGARDGVVATVETSPVPPAYEGDDWSRAPTLAFRSPNVRRVPAGVGERGNVIEVRLLSGSGVEFAGHVVSGARLGGEGLSPSGVDSPDLAVASESWMAWARPAAGIGAAWSGLARAALRPDRHLPVASRRDAGRPYDRTGGYGLAFAVSGGSSVARVSLPLAP